MQPREGARVLEGRIDALRIVVRLHDREDGGSDEEELREVLEHEQRAHDRIGFSKEGHPLSPSGYDGGGRPLARSLMATTVSVPVLNGIPRQQVLDGWR